MIPYRVALPAATPIPLRRCMLRGASALLLLLLLAPRGWTLDITASFDIGNLAFAVDRVETDLTFPGTRYPWGFELGVKQALSDSFSFGTSLERDMILRNTVYNTITYSQSFLAVGVGPFFGLFNSTTSLLKPGISTSVQLEFPGIAYVSFRSDSTIGGRLVEVTDYTQERSEIAVGVYVPNVIMSAALRTRRFSQLTAAQVETVDALSIYAFETDIYKKNTPYKVLLSFGYHHLTRSFIHADDPTASVTHTLNSIVLGTSVDMYLTRYLTTSVNLESSMYTFGGDSLLGISNPGPGGYLFRASAGVTINTDEIVRK